MSYAFPLLVLAGTAGGLLFHWLLVPGGAMFGAVLATSPGGLQAVVGLAVDMGESAPTVMAFHIVRLYTVIILAPLLSWLLHHFLR